MSTTEAIVIASIFFALVFVWLVAVKLSKNTPCQHCVDEDEMFENFVNRALKTLTPEQLRNATFIATRSMYCLECGRGPIDIGRQIDACRITQTAQDSRVRKPT
jgi:hypothetical protein